MISSDLCLVILMSNKIIIELQKVGNANYEIIV